MKHNQSFAREDMDTALAQTQTQTAGKLQTMEVMQGFGLMAQFTAKARLGTCPLTASILIG
jgi:ABC-type enterochelin transport system substrate-binding protein